ncbi:MAG: tail fiber protein [Bacteroidales bacterium]|nr:tail fiber protein [Bacteroidales bacterium]
MAKYVSPEGLDDALKAVATTVGSLSTRISNNAQGLQTLSSEIPTKVSQLQNDSGYTTNKGTVTGVKINGTTKSPSSGVVDLGTVITAHQDISGKVDKVDGKGLSTNDFTTTLKNKLNGIASGAEVNQNAFSNIAVGDTMLAADSKTDLLTIAAGNNITLTPDASATKLTISASVPTLSSLMGSSAIGGTSSYIYWDGSKWATKSLGTLAFSSATSFPASDVYSWAKASTKPSYTKSEVGLGNVTNDAQVKRSEMGVASGVATLDASGLVPTSQLPSYVDDVLEYSAKSSFPTTGVTGKIYVDTSTNKTYRWGGSAYVEISASLALGTTSSTAYRGDLGAQNATNISALQSSVSTLQGYFDSTAAKVAKQTLYSLTVGSKTFNGSSAITITKSDLGLGNVENKSSATIRSEITKANVTSALGTGTGTTKYLREDGSWATPPDTNTNTTYSFSGGTNQFTVTPSNGSALTVTITPSISNNVTYSGTLTSGQVAVLDGTSGKIKASGYTIAKSVPSDAKFTDTTYSYVSPKQDGSEYGLTASGEKYEWNQKQNAISDLSTIRSNASNGATAYGWGNHASAGYQKASTAINTSNIGSQSVNYANSAGSAPASDVYSWAKASSKPSYNFGELGYGNAIISDGQHSLRLRTSATWGSSIYHHTDSDEAVVFLNRGLNNGSIANYTTSWIFAYGDPANRPSWTTLTPALQIKGQSVVINKLIGGKVGADYNLDVNGTMNATTIYQNGTTLANTYLGKSSTAADSSKLNGQSASYYLNYNNLSNKPTIPTNTNQLTNGAGFITGIKTLTLSSGSTSVSFNGTSDAMLSISGSNGVTATPSVSGNALTVSISGNNASTSAKGVVQLSDAINSTSTSLAATANAVKKAYDLAASKTSNTGTITQIKVNGTSIATSGVANIPIATSSADGAMSSTHVSKLSSVESAVNALSSEKLDKPSAWVNPSLTLSGAASVSTNPVRYRLCGNLLTIQGAFTYTYGSASDGTLKLFTLPSGYRSSYSHSSWQYATGNWMWRLFINTDGVVYIHSIVNPKTNTTTNSSSMTFLITVSYYLD